MTILQSDDDARPWEQSGGLRRDVEPHRGGLMEALGAALSLMAVPVALFLAVVLSFRPGV